MKKNLLLAVLALTAMASCKEKGPLIDFSGAVAKDTTYMTTPPASAQARNVLLEEFTGIKCVNCPDGHAAVTALEAANPGHLIPIAIHPKNNPLSENLPNISPIDLRTDDGTTIASAVYNTPTAFPSGGIDRTPYSGTLVMTKDLWPAAIQSRLASPGTAPVTLTIASTYEASSNTAAVKVTAIYSSTVSKKQVMTLALVEDGIIAPQEDRDPTGVNPNITIPNYTHNHILRKVYTFPTGSPMIDSVATKTPGRAYERTFILTPDASWNVSNCKLIAIVSNSESGDKEVMQAVEAPLKP